jgi:glycine/D-amino acid oxidase-like deaminating enzyme
MLGGGVSGKTTAHITIQHDRTYDRYIRRFGLTDARIIAKANTDAVEEIRSIIEENDIYCDFSEKNSYIFTANERGADMLRTEFIAARKLGIPSELITDSAAFPLPYNTALCFSRQADFHPIKYLNGLARAAEKLGAVIYENTRVLRIERGRLKTASAEVSAGNIIIATHNPVINVPGYYFMRMYQDRSYAGVYDGAPEINGMWTSIDKEGHTFRSHGGHLIMSGQDHRCGAQGRVSHFAEINRWAQKHFPGCGVVNNYSSQDGITLDNLPYIGKYSPASKNLYVATGYGKWGMTNSNIAAKILANLILGLPDEAAAVYSPSRLPTLHAVGSALAIAAVITAHYIGGLFRPKCPTCAHMKCKCTFNMDEKSWDCPCHGSRYSAEGEVLDTPAIHGLQDK